jgi:glycosyltransferase involved in cell wall biosynthesis
MNILHVISSMDPKSGGPCQGIRNSSEAFRDLGCTKEVVCLDDPRSPYLGKDSFPIHALGQGRGPLAYHHALVPWLFENISRFDAVIVNGIWQWHSIATWLAIRSLKKKSRGGIIPPYFVMPHGMLDPWFQRAKSRRLKAIRNWFYWKLVEHRVIRDAEGLLFTCEEELMLARTTFRPYQPKREINVGYGIAEPPPNSEEMDKAFRAKCPDLSKGQPYLLFLSRIHPKKGVDLLIRAYAKVVVDQLKVKGAKLEGHDQSGRSDIGDRSLDKGQTPPSNPASAQSPIAHSLSPITRAVPALVIAGPLDSTYATQMIRLAESLLPGSVWTPESNVHGRIDDTSLPRSGVTPSGLPSAVYRAAPQPLGSPPASIDGGYKPSIHFVGMLQGDAKWGAIYGCDAFVLPSHQENFGIAVVEALACNRPVLISNQVNIWREIESSRGGLVAEDTPGGTAKLLTQWLQMTAEEKSEHHPRECYRKHFEVRGATETFVKALKEYV